MRARSLPIAPARPCAGGLALLPLVVAALAATATAEPVKNGFDLAEARVPPEQIVEGGPPRDGIKSVDEPRFVPPGESRSVQGRTPVHGLALGGEAHVYPEHVMEYHQIVNDRLGDRAVVATYDPLTGVPAAYDRTVEGRTLTFGVSGLLYNHSFLLYDRETESLWVQFTGRAIAGPLAGERLPGLRVHRETVDIWLARYADSRILRRPFPEKIDYRVSQFQAYWGKDSIPFPVKAKDRSIHAKDLVLGVSAEGASRAYLGSVVTKAGGEVVDTFQGHTIRFVYDTDLNVFSWEIPEALRVREGYWLAWKAFHPETDVWRPEEADAEAPRGPAGGE